MATQDQINKAIQAGYSQAQIDKYLSAKNPKKTWGGFAGNVGDSAVNMVGGLANTVLHPIDTAKSIVGLGSGIIQLAIPGEQGNEKLAKAVGQFYLDRYGSVDKIKNTIYSDPVGFAMDVSTVLGLGAGATKVAGLGKLSKGLSTASKITDPLSVVGNTGKLLGGGKNKLAGALASESENILTRGMGNPMTLKKAKGVSPVSMNELFSKYNLYDRSPEAFQAGATQANKAGKTLLESAPTSIGTSRIIKLFDDEIAKLSAQAKTSTKAQLAMDELVNRREMFLGGIQNSDVSTPLMSDATKIYDIKSSFQGDLPESSFGQPTADIGKNLGVKKAYKTLLSGIEEQAPGVKNLGREQSALLKLKDMATSQEARGAAKQNINFSRMGGAGVGGILGGIPGAVGGYVAERVANSPQFLAGSSKAMQLGSKALNSGVKLPSSVGTGANIGYNGIKAVRMASPINQNEKYSNTTLPIQQPLQVKSVPYKGSIPQPKKPGLTKEIKYNQPKSVFNNKSAFGKTFRLKARN